MLISLLLSLLSLTLPTTAHCPKSLLLNTTTAYLTAQSNGLPTILTPLTTPNATYTENFAPAILTAGILTHPLNINHNRSFYDTTACSTFTELIVADPQTPYVIGTRMVWEGNKVGRIESLVTTTGDWAFNATGYLYYDSLENWSPIPESERESRESIQAVGDSYFDRFNNTNVTVPWGPPCARLEGGFYVTGNLTGTNCTMAWPDTLVEVDRRYVIDEEMGVVDIMSGFPGLDESQGDAPMPDSHLFRVKGGKIQFLHTVSHCVERGCGINGSVFGRKV